MKKYFTKNRIIVLAIILCLLSINYFLRERPYRHLNELIAQNIPTYESGAAKIATDKINEEIETLLYFALNYPDTSKFKFKVKTSNIRYLKMKLPEVVKRSKISNQTDMNKFSIYMDKIMACYFETLSKFGEQYDIEDGFQRNFIERYYYFDF